ncbi:MAG TPA: GtrA family protein [Anaerolineae bacterium]
MFVDVAGRFGVKTKEAERFFKFAVVGAIGFVVDFGIFNLLLDPLDLVLSAGADVHNMLVMMGLAPEQVIKLSSTLAGVISFIAAIISNFLWNRYWTYPDSRSRSLRRQFAMFVVVSIAGILIRAPVIHFTHQPFTRLVSKVGTLAVFAKRIGDNMALILAVIIVMFWNFFVNRYWTYGDVDSF